MRVKVEAVTQLPKGSFCKHWGPSGKADRARGKLLAKFVFWVLSLSAVDPLPSSRPWMNSLKAFARQGKRYLESQRVSMVFLVTLEHLAIELDQAQDC